MNIPEIKLGIIAVSRDCFPIALSTQRRKNVVAAYGEGLYECPITVENEKDALAALEDVKSHGVNALVVYLGNFGPETPETILCQRFDGPTMYVAAAEGDGDVINGRGDAYCGVIVLDELDKLMEPVSSSDWDFHRQGLENLLKMLDGGTVVNRQGETIHCGRLLVIGMGAFSPLKQESEERPIGFAAEAPAARKDNISKESMTAFCGSEQFLGRFMTVLHFKPLSRKLYKRIVDQTIAEITALYGNFLFPAGEKTRIVEQAMSSEFGCRSVKSAVWEVFLNLDTVISKPNLGLLLALREAKM